MSANKRKKNSRAFWLLDLMSLLGSLPSTGLMTDVLPQSQQPTRQEFSYDFFTRVVPCCTSCSVPAHRLAQCNGLQGRGCSLPHSHFVRRLHWVYYDQDNPTLIHCPPFLADLPLRRSRFAPCRQPVTNIRNGQVAGGTETCLCL